MKPDEKIRWNKKYSEGPVPSLEPEEFLLEAFREYLGARPPGLALDVAGGAGRHALWLAQQGWRIKLVDVSEDGVALAQERFAKFFPSRTGAPALSEPVSPVLPVFTTEVVDLNLTPGLGDEQYDLVVVFLYLQRELFPALIRALKPEGFLIYQTYTAAQPQCGGPANPQYLLQPNELLQAFASLHVWHYRERPLGRAVAQIVAQKTNMR